MVTSVPAVTIVAADHSLRRAAPNGIEASRVIKILPALVPGPWTPGTTRPDGGSQSVYVLRTRMVQTSERISSVASKAHGERSAQMPYQACKPKHKRPTHAAPTCGGHCTAGQAATGPTSPPSQPGDA